MIDAPWHPVQTLWIHVRDSAHASTHHDGRNVRTIDKGNTEDEDSETCRRLGRKDESCRAQKDTRGSTDPLHSPAVATFCSGLCDRPGLLTRSGHHN
jgi:hypothetical protein